MTNQELWQKFKETGHIIDYLKYCQVKNKQQ